MWSGTFGTDREQHGKEHDGPEKRSEHTPEVKLGGTYATKSDGKTSPAKGTDNADDDIADHPLPSTDHQAGHPSSHPSNDDPHDDRFKHRNSCLSVLPKSWAESDYSPALSPTVIVRSSR
jgi:hypothetical protein